MTTVGIIGGTGRMGILFKEFFEKNNCRVLVSSRNTKLDMEDCARQSDVVLVSVPMDVTMKVIRKVAPCVNKNSLLIDSTSIKKEPVAAMLRYSKCEVIGMHPVFGPGVDSFKNQTIVLCPARTKKWLKWMVGIFEKNGAMVKITTPEKHDEMMSIVQGLNHFSTLTVAHAMKELGISVNESFQYTSPVYNLRMIMIGRILNQNPKLYADIEMMNPENNRAIEVYSNSIKKLQKIIATKNTKEFLKYFNECAEYFGNFKEEAEKMSNYLINKIAEREK